MREEIRTSSSLVTLAAFCRYNGRRKVTLFIKMTTIGDYYILALSFHYNNERNAFQYNHGSNRGIQKLLITPIDGREFIY